MPRARRTRITLQSGEHRHSYAALDRVVDQAAVLLDRGIGGGARFAILARNSDLFCIMPMAAGPGRPKDR